MKMNNKTLIACALVLLSSTAVRGQGTFQNLGFEAAIVPDLPPNQNATLPIADVCPGWTGYIGTNQTATVNYNGYSLGSPLISLITTNTAYVGQNVIRGRFTAILSAGTQYPFDQGPLSAALAQTGLVPVSARQLRFSSSPFWPDSIANLRVSFNGQNLPFYPVADLGNYVEYWADISAFAGVTGELRFTEYPITRIDATVLLDRILFSNVPEPSLVVLLALGAGLVLWQRRRCGAR